MVVKFERIEVLNVNSDIMELQKRNLNKLPKYAWPGGYPIYYVDNGNQALCYDCAIKNDEFTEQLTAYDINYENTSLTCDHCSKKIESAYCDEEQPTD